MGRLAARGHIRFKFAELRKRTPLFLPILFLLSALIPALLYFSFLRSTARPFRYPLITVCSPTFCDPEQALNKLLAADPFREKEILCGSSACMKTFEKNAYRLQSTIITRLKLWDLAQDTPLHVFVARHKELKLRMGAEFAFVMHQVAVLLALWHRGGHYVDLHVPRRFFRDPLAFEGLNPEVSQTWIHPSGLITSAFLPPSASLLHDTMVLLQRGIEMTGSMPSDLNPTIRAASRGETADLSFLRPSTPSLARSHHYGILGYDHSTAITRKSNTGDEVQALTGLQFLPYNDVILDRNSWKVAPKASRCTFNATTENDVNKRRLLIQGKRCSIPTGNASVTAFLNAWYGRRRQYWPPPPAIDPLLLALYIGPMFQGHAQSQRGSAYLRARGPVGARDTATLAFFQKIGVPAYMSACATLLFRRSYMPRGMTSYSVDVDDGALRLLLPDDVRTNLTKVTHYHPEDTRFDRTSRYERALEMISLYERARFVITSRIHVALPCVALGIPVIFVHSSRLPGGGGNRTAGLTDLFHTTHVSANGSFIPLEFDWSSPPPNPRPDLVTMYRARLWHRIRSRPALRDAAVTLGIVPYPPPSHSPHQPSLFLVDPPTQGRAQRAVEAALAAHPFATITVLSNTLPSDTLEGLADVGYGVSTRRYNVKGLLSALSAYDSTLFSSRTWHFAKWRRSLRRGKIASEADAGLARLVTLYFRGGIYIHSDVLLQRTVDEIHNAAAVNGDRVPFMTFEPYSGFVRRVLVRFLDNGKGSYPPSLDSLVTEMLEDPRARGCQEGRCEAYKLDHAAFYSVEWTRATRKCFARHNVGASDEAFGAVLKDADKTPAEHRDMGQVCVDLLSTKCIVCVNEE